jgi:cobaltochelatase CobS
MVKVHPYFQVIACANTFGRGATLEYNGRNPLDAASLDRFAYMFIDYDENMERLLYGNGPWVQYIHRVRHAVAEIPGLRHVISQRAIRRVLSSLAAGQSVEETLFGSLWRGLDEDTINKIKSRAGNPPAKLTIVSDLNDDDDEEAINE